MNNQLLDTLLWLLKRNHPNDKIIFSKIVDILSAVRTFSKFDEDFRTGAHQLMENGELKLPQLLCELTPPTASTVDLNSTFSNYYYRHCPWVRTWLFVLNVPLLIWYRIMWRQIHWHNMSMYVFMNKKVQYVRFRGHRCTLSRIQNVRVRGPTKCTLRRHKMFVFVHSVKCWGRSHGSVRSSNKCVLVQTIVTSVLRPPMGLAKSGPNLEAALILRLFYIVNVFIVYYCFITWTCDIKIIVELLHNCSY